MFHDKHANNHELAEVSPLIWWRLAPVDAFSFREANRVRRALRGVDIYGEADWRIAVHGDAAAAIGVAIRVAMRQPCDEAVVDLVASPVLLAAIDGDSAARVLLSHLLMKRAACDPAARKLAVSWREADRNAAQLVQSAKAQPSMRPPRSRRVMSCAPAW